LVIKENRFNEESEQSMAETTENTVNLPYRNPELPTEERIADLLGRMTLEEKVGQMMQLDARSGDLDDLIVNKHVGSILHTSPSDLPKAVETVNAKTRLGIPLVIGDDCIHGYSFWPGATIFPEQLGMATTWDSEKVQAAGRATAEEGSFEGSGRRAGPPPRKCQPPACIGRSPRCCASRETPVGAAWAKPLAKIRT